MTLEEVVKELKAAPRYEVHRGFSTMHPCDLCGRQKNRFSGAENCITYAYDKDSLKSWEEDTMSQGVLILGGTCLKKVLQELKRK